MTWSALTFSTSIHSSTTDVQISVRYTIKPLRVLDEAVSFRSVFPWNWRVRFVMKLM